MKFWLIYDEGESVIGCELTKRSAKEKANEMGYGSGEFSLEWIEVEVTAESIRRLLGQIGGYAKYQGEIERQ